MKIEKVVSLRNIGFTVSMRYRRLCRIGKGGLYEVNRQGSRIFIEKKRLPGKQK